MHTFICTQIRTPQEASHLAQQYYARTDILYHSFIPSIGIYTATDRVP
jgi:hypothetical protein